MFEELPTIISNVGFPIALSMYLLVRIEGKLEILSGSINDLSKALLEFKK
ncbi:MAG: YvrJ family protein [Peptostreptococcaceae bacterium]